MNKRLVPGSIVLGQIAQINRYDLSLSLPNNLTGYVPLNLVSDKVTKKVEALAGEEEGAAEEDDDNDSDRETSLDNLFAREQYLRAYVTATQHEDSTGAKGKRHIGLSINPREVNAGLTKADVVTNIMVQASVLSVEDHGLIMDLGLEDTSVKGFMSSKEIGPDVDVSNILEGAVYLCIVTGKSSNGNIIKLSADPQRIGNVKKGNYLTDAPTINSFLPGTAVDVLVSEVTPVGIAGKVMGMLDVTADLIHSGAASSGKDLEKKYTVGSKVKGRIICTFPKIEEKKLGISLQDHVLYWRSKNASSPNATGSARPIERMPISSIVEQATVVKIEHGVGIFVDIGVKGVRGFVHISKVSDGKIETLSESTGPYKLGSTHKARVIGYNYMDGLFIVSMEPKVINQPFFRLEDVKAGQVVKGTIEKLMVNETGVSGLLLNIAEGITGLVPEIHFADVHLQHPEKKFKEGSSVTARVLSTNLVKRQIRLTLKKSLVNSDVTPWTEYKDLQPGLQSPGTLINITPTGAVVQFYGSVRAFLPVSEMSESYIQNPKQHFRNGQVVNVHIVSVEPSEGRMIVSCKDPGVFGAAKQEALQNLKLTERVVGRVTEKTGEELVLELEPSGLKAALPIDHLADRSAQKCQSAAGRIRIDQVLKDLIILSKQVEKRLIKVTSKPSLMKAAEQGQLLTTFEDVIEGSEVHGFVKNITPTGIFVQFAGELTGLLLSQHLADDALKLPDSGMHRNKSIAARVLSVDYNQKRFLLTMKAKTKGEEEDSTAAQATSNDIALSNAVDGTSTSIDDFTLGKRTKAKIVSIKNTQLNVQLADGVQGRIDVSEVFDRWENINDRKHPLKKFHVKQILPVRILGMHDSRNHRFLPITHRSKAPVFELTAKPSNQNSAELGILTIDKVEVGSAWLAYVNNVSDDCLWVNLSPNVRGRIRAMDVSDDVSALKDKQNNFPVGSALKATVLKIDIENNHLDLSARAGAFSTPKTFDDLSIGMVLPSRVTKVTECQVMVQLSESLSAPIYLVDLADDYSKADLTVYQKNQVLRVCVKGIDKPNKRITLSARASKVLSSTLPVKDPDVVSVAQLKVNDIMRGFIKNIADNGIFISLASNVTAFVRVSDLSDAYIKDWQAGFEIDQLVEGKVIAVDTTLNHVQMSLKQSHMEKDYKPPLMFSDIKYGQTVTGKVRKVEDFGLFIVVDDSANVSGLCHRTKMSDRPGADPKKLYEEGDAVQAKVISINKEKRQISFGLRASYFEKPDNGDRNETKNLEDDEIESASDSDEAEDWMNGVEIDGANGLGEDEGSESDMNLDHVADIDSDAEMDDSPNEDTELPQPNGSTPTTTNSFKGLSTGGFDWTGGLATQDDTNAHSETDTESLAPKKKKRKRAVIKIDHTGDLDAHGPQSTADFERLLMGRPNSSVLWLQYMAFQLQTNEAPSARETAERALRTIHMTEEGEKLNIWIAMLNLENTYGTDDSLDAVFKRACTYNDSLEMHQRLASIYIQSSAYAKADSLFQAAIKKHSQSPDLYINYATFLFTQLSSPDRARALLARAMQSLRPHTHLDLTSKFAQLEFTTPSGDPERGRTVFETLLSQWPKRLDLWNVWLDLEMKLGDQELVRRLFERVTGKGTSLKPRKAKFLFKKWLDWEGRSGDRKNQERVKALAGEYVRGQGKEGDSM